MAEWGAKEVAPRAVGLAMEAQKHAEQVTPAVIGLAMNTKEHAEQVEDFFLRKESTSRRDIMSRPIQHQLLTAFRSLDTSLTGALTTLFLLPPD